MYHLKLINVLHYVMYTAFSWRQNNNIIGQPHPCLCVYYTNSKFEHHWNAIFNIIVKPPNKGHIEDNINSLIVERLSSSQRLSMYRNCKEGSFFGTSSSVPCREVFYIVSLSQRVHYQRFHYTELSYACCIHVHLFM